MLECCSDRTPLSIFILPRSCVISCYSSCRHPPPVYVPTLGSSSCNKAVPVQTWAGPESSRSLRPPDFLDIRHMQVARLSGQHTGHVYPQRRYSWYSFSIEAESKSVKNLNDLIGNRTFHLPACSLNQLCHRVPLFLVLPFMIYDPHYSHQARDEVKEKVELYLYSPSGPSWPVREETLPLPLPLLFPNTINL